MSSWKIIQPQSSDITNLCTNPSFEAGTAGWAAGSSFSISKNASYAYRGIYSLGCASSGGSVAASYSITLPSTNSTYKITCRALIVTPTTTYIAIDASNFTGGIVTQTTTATNPGALQWYLLQSTLAVGADVTGTIDIDVTCGPSDTFFIDCVSIIEADDYYTYFDGDTDNCYWTGADYASTSVAPEGTRNVGIEIDLEDDLSFRVLQAIGMGELQTRHVTTLASGAPPIFERVSKVPRVLTLVGNLQGTSESNLHSLRKAITDIIHPNKTKEKYYLRYYGANSTKPVELECVLDGGFEGNTISANTETIDWRSIAYDPDWYELSNQKVSLSTRGQANMDYIAAKVNGDWSDLSSGFDGTAFATVYDRQNDIIYVGGNFSSPYGYLVKYQNDAWASMGTLNGRVLALAVAPNGDLYAGGEFTTINGNTRNRIARYDYSGGTWAALGTGLSDLCQAIEIDRRGSVFVGGAFTTASGGTVNKFTCWTGSAFTNLGGGVNNDVYTIVADRANNIYIGGAFTTAGTAAGTVNYTAKWNDTNYSALGSGMGAYVNDLALDQSGNLYAGGAFTTSDGVTTNYVSMWNGAGWFPMGSGMNDLVYSLGSYDGYIWAAGAFTTAGGRTLNDRLAIWNGTEWVHGDIDLPGNPTIRDIEVINKTGSQDIYLAFDTSGTATYSVDTTATNSGDTDTYPVLEIWNEGGSTNTSITYLKNETTGATIWMDYVLQIEEKIVIDFNPQRFSVMSSHFGDVSEMILGGSDRNFYLQPGTNVITCFTPSASVTAGLSWRIPHWSADGVAT